jgi:hypothetical protein
MTQGEIDEASNSWADSSQGSMRFSGNGGDIWKDCARAGFHIIREQTSVLHCRWKTKFQETDSYRVGLFQLTRSIEMGIVLAKTYRLDSAKSFFESRNWWISDHHRSFWTNSKRLIKSFSQNAIIFNANDFLISFGCVFRFRRVTVSGEMRIRAGPTSRLRRKSTESEMKSLFD